MKKNWNNPFFIKFRGEKRYLRPDLVVQNNINELFCKFVSVKVLKKYDNSTFKNQERFDLEVASKVGGDAMSFFDFFVKSLAKESKSYSRAERTKKHVVFHSYHCLKYEDVKDFCLGVLEQKYGSCYIIDWKYVDESFFEDGGLRVNQSFIKQLCYEECLSSSEGIRNKFIKNQIGYPFYPPKEWDRTPFLPVQANDLKLPSYIEKSGVSLFRVNFVLMQEVYLKNAKT